MSIRNLSSTTVFGDFEIEIPAGLTVITLDGASACFGSRAHWSCGMNSAMGPGELRTVTVYFGSFAAGERYARITAPGKVTAAPSGTTTRNAWESDDYAGILRSTTGSVRHPRPYQPSTVPDLALTAGSTVVTRDDTGTYLVRVPLTVQDRNDAFNIGAYLRIDAPEGHGFPHVEPTAICIGVCDVWGGWMASGESRDLAVLFTMPSGTAPGSYQVTVTGTMNENNGTPADVTPENNAVTASFTIPA